MKFITLALLWSFCTFAQEVVPRKAEDDLTYLKAQQRKSQVKKVKYDLFFKLDKGSETFKGTTVIELEMARLDLPLSIDFFNQKIKTITVNGEELKKYPKRLGSFEIPQARLKPLTKIEIDYQSEFCKESSGFKRVVDPADGAEYLYTDFEPYYAHWLFPSLDQPDLKANFKVTVSAPSEWKVIQNELPESEKVNGKTKTTIFQETKPLSTYLFFLGAGPFVEWKDSFGDLPLYLYARKSLAQYVDVENIMLSTKTGLKFFNEYFDYPYPFSKYGHIFVPEFGWGGMENPGAVTLNERNIFRGPVPQTRYDGRNSLIMHEMAHMWFGDLVTMEWWNDLWLNESFASYLAEIAQDRAMEAKSTWLRFFQSKTWGYWQDQLITTHPIETDVPDVRTAKGNFDGITYAKGASALKQLHFYVGEEGFREGLRTYFKTFAFKNTKRSDFIRAIGMAAKKDLSVWTNKWLQTAGPNRVLVEAKCDDGKIESVIIHQRPSVSDTLSPHRTRLAFYEEDGSELKLQGVHEAVYSKEKSVIDGLSGKDCPDFIFPNKDDQDYALYSLDKKSLSKTKTAIVGLPDPLSRLMLWSTLAQMVRDAELSPLKYFEYAFEGLQKEEDKELLGSLLGRNVTGAHYNLYLTKVEREVVAQKLEEIILKRMDKSEKGSSLQMSFFDFYLSIAQSKTSQNNLYKMLQKNNPPQGIVLDQDRRWAIIVNLARNHHKEALKLIESELKKDKSTIGKTMALSARAAYPDLENKRKVWSEFYNDKSLSKSDLRAAGHYIHDADHPELSEPFVDAYFARIEGMDWKSHDDMVGVYLKSFYPLQTCSDKVLKQSEKSMQKAKHLTTIARRSWMESQDELKKCLLVRRAAKN